VLASNNAGGAIEPDGDVPSLGGGGSSVTVVNDLTTGGTTAALSAEMGKTLQTNKLGANADAIADVLEAAATGAPADLARIQSSVSGDTLKPINKSRTLSGGAIGGHLGASITNGAGSSNAGTTSWSAKLSNNLPIKKGTLGARLVSAHPGQPLTYIATQMAPLAGCDYLVVGPDNGTNGSGIGGALIPHADWIAACESIITTGRGWGVPIIFCLSTPTASSQDAQAHIEIRRRNAYLLTNVAKRGIKVVDTHSPLMDRATGYLAAIYDSGDGVHPNDAGHLVIANLLIAYISTILPEVEVPVGIAGVGGTIPLGLLTNPLMLGASGSLPTGWTLGAGTLTGFVYSMVDPVPGEDLPQGRWFKAAVTATGASSRRIASGSPNDATSVQTGDKMLVLFRCKGGGDVGTVIPRVTNQAGTVLYSWPAVGSTLTEGRLYYTVPAGTARIILNFEATASGAGTVECWFGMAEIVNTTRQEID
jgi:hypothetical protein